METATQSQQKLCSLPLVLRLVQAIDFPRKLGCCERLFGNYLSRKGVCWVKTAAGLPWKLDLTSPTHRWIVYGKYEGSGFLNWARAHLPRDGVVVDSGANIGQVALYLSQWIPEGTLLAFEPGREARNWLKECLALNPHLPVQVMPVALGESSATMILKPLGTDLMHGSWNQVSSDGDGESIEVCALSDVLSEHGVETVHLWKLDVEGYELMALAGAEELLRRKRIRSIYVELGFGNGERIRDYLRNLGYTCHQISPGGRPRRIGKLPDHTNALFLPRE